MFDKEGLHEIAEELVDVNKNLVALNVTLQAILKAITTPASPGKAVSGKLFLGVPVPQK
jgi:hypothetical protein